MPVDITSCGVGDHQIKPLTRLYVTKQEKERGWGDPVAPSQRLSQLLVWPVSFVPHRLACCLFSSAGRGAGDELHRHQDAGDSPQKDAAHEHGGGRQVPFGQHLGRIFGVCRQTGHLQVGLSYHLTGAFTQGSCTLGQFTPGPFTLGQFTWVSFTRGSLHGCRMHWGSLH